MVTIFGVLLPACIQEDPDEFGYSVDAVATVCLVVGDDSSLDDV